MTVRGLKDYPYIMHMKKGPPSRLVFGWLSDIFRKSYIIAASMVLTSIGLFLFRLLVVVPSDQSLALLLFTVPLLVHIFHSGRLFITCELALKRNKDWSREDERSEQRTLEPLGIMAMGGALFA